jgi:aryl-alcohol dehydrogenase-like predicted oxidoreductase
VTRLGLGLAALGRPGYITLGHADDLAGDYAVAAMEARAHAVLDAAYAGGVRYYDAARSYGRAEAFLASWLASRHPTGVVVGSKWGYAYTAGWQVSAPVHEEKAHTLERLGAQWRESRSILGHHLKLYQVHSATLDSGILEDAAVLDRLAALREEHGVTLGLSLSGAEQARTLEQARGLSREGRPLFDAVQATYNALEPSAASALMAAHDAGVGVIVKEALANGRLTSRNPDPVQRRVLERQARRLGTSPDALALAFALREPWADVVLSGAATPEHLASNLEAPQVALDDEALSAFCALRESPEAYWKTRSALPWN